MSVFVCTLRRFNSGLTPSLASNHGNGDHIRSGVTYSDDGVFVVNIAAEAQPEPSQLAHAGSFTAVGNVRLANRATLARMLPMPIDGISDTAVVVRLVSQLGIGAISSLVGPFALVLWDARLRCLTLCRDAVGLQPLFYAVRSDRIVVSSRASLVTQNSSYDKEFIASWISGGVHRSTHTIFADTHVAPPGHTLVWRDETFRATRYWSPAALAPSGRVKLDDATEELRELLADALHFDLDGSDGAWVSLSGGVDSSTLVSMVEFLHRNGRLSHGLAGTVSLFDPLADGDEREFSDEVAKSWSVRNEIFPAGWLWQDFSDGSPLPDLPLSGYPLIAPSRAIGDFVRRQGGKIFLTGLGPDHSMLYDLIFLADLLARGHFAACIREALRWAIARRTSLWSTLWHNAIAPVVPVLRTVPAKSIPKWVSAEFKKEYDLETRAKVSGRRSAPLGRKYETLTAEQVESLAPCVYPTLFDDALAIRHPFLHRPLLEFLLRLPATLKTQPRASKYVLRESMRTIVPERVRSRTTKGGAGARLYWSFSQECATVRRLTHDPLLGELGVIDPRVLERAVKKAQRGVGGKYVQLIDILALETWLRVHAGCWINESRQPELGRAAKSIAFEARGYGNNEADLSSAHSH